MNGGLVRLKELYQDLKPSEQIAASYILQHPERMLQLSIAQLADESGSSQAAIVRLCKSMGVTGYQNLKLMVAGDLQQGQTSLNGSGYQEIRPGESVENIIASVAGNNMQSIQDSVKVLDPAVVRQAIEALDRAQRIFFYGIGASNLIAMDAQQKFMRISKTALAFADPHVQLTASVSLGKRDVAVGISYSGETKAVIAALRSAREQGAETVSITKFGNTTLSGYADYPLFISSTEHEIRSGAMASRIAQLNVIDILYLGVASRNYNYAVQQLELSRKAIKEIER
ncbi:MurR/RpiR family transcriptional regulator [Paenibacillus aurantius]|uniref:MurR/RpiR family transcriptional regulator n=1 Tax=Paenibacillus aurantius TaxID=2918900 RepID=A0AA96RFZ1_9BACL|nr:MurR/RpiR family transcriptional regulator [Paenibacillus aurantius]WNQ11996.1 MurR/RpiR family transcriptional regulator [Paenibacillus aurantius]